MIPDGLSPFMTEQLVAARLAALEGLLEAGWMGEDEGDSARVLEWARMLRSLAVSEPLVVFALTLAGRSLAADGKSELADEAFTEAEVALRGSYVTEQRWLDWIAPSSLRDRVRLERVRHASGSPAEFAAWSAEAIERASSIDAERLLSRILQIRLGRGVVAASDLDGMAFVVRYEPARQPVCAAHRSTPPLFVTVALERLARGDVVGALGGLTDHQEWAREARDDATVRAAELALLQVVRRMRLVDPGIALATRVARSDDVELADAAVETLLMITNREVFEQAPVQDRIRTLFRGAAAPQPMSETPEGELDYEEWRRLTGARRVELPSIDVWASELSLEPERFTRLALRHTALTGSTEAVDVRCRGRTRSESDGGRSSRSRRAS